MTDLRFADPTQLFNAPFAVVIDGEQGRSRDAVAVVLAEEAEAENATLRASLERMREAAQGFLDAANEHLHNPTPRTSGARIEAERLARAALAETETEES